MNWGPNKPLKTIFLGTRCLWLLVPPDFLSQKVKRECLMVTKERWDREEAAGSGYSSNLVHGSQASSFLPFKKFGNAWSHFCWSQLRMRVECYLPLMGRDQDAAKYSTIHSTNPHNEEWWVPNINSAKAEKSWVQGLLLFSWGRLTVSSYYLWDYTVLM